MVGAGADDLILLCARTFLAPAAGLDPRAHLCPLPHRHAPDRRRSAPGAGGRGEPDLALQPEQPDRCRDAGAPSWSSLHAPSRGRGRRRRGIRRVRRRLDRAVARGVPESGRRCGRCRRRSASRRCGSDSPSPRPTTAAVLEARRAPAPIAGPAARIAAAALREPRFDLAPDDRGARAHARSACRGRVGRSTRGRELRLAALGTSPGERLEEQGLIVRRFAQGIRITLRRPPENDILLRALGAEAGPAPGREATVIRTTTETALRITLDLDGAGQSRVATGIGFLDHLLTLMAFHAGFDLDCEAGGDIDVDEHHTVEDVLASLGSALAQALGTREGVTRYGSAVVPMDEARATAAVDLVRRPHAEIALVFTGERVGGLALSLLPHALERFTMEAGCTVHVDAAGDDDHHVAEAAFKALGQALAGRRPGRRRDPLDQRASREGGARRLRRRQPAVGRPPFGRRPGAEPAISTDAAPRARSAARGDRGRRPRRERRPRTRAHRVSTRPSASARGRQARARDLRRHAAALRGKRGGRGRARPARGARPPPAGAARAPHGLECPARDPALGAPRRRRRCGRLLRAQLRGRAGGRGVAAADVDHDGRIVAAVEAGSLAGVQFHPERSGPAGARILENALAWSRSV